MKNTIISLLLLITGIATASAQAITGTVYDHQNEEPLPSVTILYEVGGEIKGMASGADGTYYLELPPGAIDVTFSYLGYEDERVMLILKPREVVERDIFLRHSTNLMEQVVVSAGRFEQKLSDLTVSMDLLRSSDIAKQSPTDLSAALNTLPGVDINDKQPSIRGGSGWTYGVGSRSQILVDGMSILNPGTGEINWNTVPMENVEQVEVLKGASSVLYGSSALNGLINVRTSRPGMVPKTTVKTYVGFYGDPAEKSYQWWDKSLWSQGKYQVEPLLRRTILTGARNPIYEGIDVSHTRRIGNFDVSGGVDLFSDEGYRQNAYNQRFRIGGNLTYHQPGDNMINYGANINFLTNKYGDFFIWRSAKEPYRPSPFTNMGREGNMIRIDPFYNFTNPDKGTSHKVKGRFFYRGDNITSVDSNTSLADILGNMGTDLSSIMDIAGRIQGGDYSDVAPIIPPLLDGNLNGVIDGALNVIHEVFPNATTSDLSDLIGWIMQRGLPTGGTSELVPWLTNAINPRKAETVVDRFYTYYLDYQYSKRLNQTGQVTLGTTYEHARNDSENTGNHNSDNAAFYFQYDQMFFDRLNVSLGVRAEYYRVDDQYREAETKMFGTKVPFKPIFRGGVNYKLADYSYLRASFGQGYRYPSLVEKYVRKDIGGVGAYPNPELGAERGFNAEIGFRQGYRIGRFQGFLDMAGFFTQYNNMVEFRFGIFNNTTLQRVNSVNDMFALLLNSDGLGIGAQFYNVSKARISGIDVSTNGMYNINRNVKMFYNLGYVYIEPIDVDYKKKNEIEAQYTDPLQMKEKSNNSKYLKYRQKHTVKGTFDFEWKRFTIGTNLTWKSKTLAVDYLMMDERPKEFGQREVFDYVREIMFGNIDGETLHSYWNRTNKGYFVQDFRVGIKVTKKVEFNVMVNNLWNKEYSTRPMAVAAPRTTICQLKLTF